MSFFFFFSFLLLLLKSAVPEIHVFFWFFFFTYFLFRTATSIVYWHLQLLYVHFHFFQEINWNCLWTVHRENQQRKRYSFGLFSFVLFCFCFILGKVEVLQMSVNWIYFWTSICTKVEVLHLQVIFSIIF